MLKQATRTPQIGQPHPFLSGGPKLMLIDGSWVPSLSGETLAAINPSTGEVLTHVQRGNAADVDLAVRAARRAFEGNWRQSTPFERQRLLLRLADLVEAHFEELAWLDSLDMGAPIARVPVAGRRPVALLRYYAGLTTAGLKGHHIDNSIRPGEYLTYSIKEPVGVVGAIIPWNAPLNSAIWKAAPALAAGCTLVLKPSEDATLVPLRLAELMLEAGYPEGVVNVVSGDGAAGAALADYPDVDKITFTGSTATGQQIIRASAGTVKRVTLELGGKSPNIVFNDADLDIAVPGAAMAVFANTGQLCSAGSRLIVQRGIYDEFCRRVARFADDLRVGHSLDPQTQIGPLTSARQLEKVAGYFELGQREGATVLAGSRRVAAPGFEGGFYVAPTLLRDVRPDMRICREEIFGPVISAMPFDTLDEAVRLGNDTAYGLGSGVWTRDLATAHQMTRRLRAGSVWVNCYQTADPAIPFGGYKLSGYGRESGAEHFEAFLETKAVHMRIS